MERCDLNAQLAKNAKHDSATHFARKVTKAVGPCAGKNALRVTGMTVTSAGSLKEKADGKKNALQA